MMAEAIIGKTCVELEIEIIDMVVNLDHVHLFIKYTSKYSVSFIAKRIKGRSSKVLRRGRASNHSFLFGILGRECMPEVVLVVWLELKKERCN